MGVDFDNCGTTVVKPHHLAHVVFKTQNQQTFQAMVEFYKAFFNAEASHENDSMSFLTYDEEHHRVAIAIFPGTGPQDPRTAGLAHVAFTFSSLQDLALAYRQRKAHGIVPFWSVNHGPTTSIYYRDPDGNEIETQVENFDTIEDANKFITSKLFAENPIGTDFDPEVLIKRLERGESEVEIKKRIEIGSRMLPPS